jgi:hypothetical protein
MQVRRDHEGKRVDRQQEHPAGQLRVELRPWVEVVEQVRLEEFPVLACEAGPAAAVTALVDMPLDECSVRHRDRFMIPIRFSQVFRVIADGAANPHQRSGKVSLPEIQIPRSHMGGMPEIAFGQLAALERSKKLLVGHGFSLRR